MKRSMIGNRYGAVGNNNDNNWIYDDIL
jgi:hypothetical protein